MDTINIVMAVYNGEAYIKDQIESILCSTYEDWILTICDDGSTDQSYEIVKEYLAKYPKKIEYKKNPKNLGHMNNFLTGAMQSRYKYVCFCDQDDVWNADKLELTYRQMKKLEAHTHHKQPIAVFTDAQIVDQKLNVLHPSFHQNSKLDTSALDLPHMLMENKIMGCTMMVNRKLLDYLTKLPTSGRYHDWWLGLIASAFGTLSYLPVPTMKYRQHEKNVVGNISFMKYVRQRIAGLKEQKKAIHKCVLQAKEFDRIYGSYLSEDKKKIVREFATLEERNWFKRRKIVLSYGFLKSGLIRNIGLFLIV